MRPTRDSECLENGLDARLVVDYTVSVDISGRDIFAAHLLATMGVERSISKLLPAHLGFI